MNLIKIDYKRNDTFKNGYDPDDNHTGIHLASVTSDPAASLDNFGIDLKSRRPIRVKFITKICGNPLQKLTERPIIMSETVPNSVYVD